MAVTEPTQIPGQTEMFPPAKAPDYWCRTCNVRLSCWTAATQHMADTRSLNSADESGCFIVPGALQRKHVAELNRRLHSRSVSNRLRVGLAALALTGGLAMTAPTATPDADLPPAIAVSLACWQTTITEVGGQYEAKFGDLSTQFPINNQGGPWYAEQYHVNDPAIDLDLVYYYLLGQQFLPAEDLQSLRYCADGRFLSTVALHINGGNPAEFYA
jgi:hypothetical protein